MLKGLYTAYTGMRNEQKRMDIVTNNLANTDTTGFKKEGVTNQAFSDVLAYRIKDSTTPGVDAKRLGSMNMGVKIGETYRDFSQGAFKTTDNTFDLALSGNGFFTIEFKDKEGNTSTMYTRDGNFNMTQDGYLVTQDGDFVLGADGNHIKLTPEIKDVSIDRQGRIYQNGTLKGTLQLNDFEDYDYLEMYGENLYTQVEGATRKAPDCQVHQGYLEASNVETVAEMVEMITITRAYEANQKVIQAYDDSLQISANQIGRVQ